MVCSSDIDYDKKKNDSNDASNTITIASNTITNTNTVKN